MNDPIVNESIENCILDGEIDTNKILKVTYDGHFFNGFKHGEGTFQWVSGTVYDGDWF